MQLKYQLIEDIFDKHFPSAKQTDIEDWLLGSILGWCETGRIDSFCPFEDFFPSFESEERNLAVIGMSLGHNKQLEEIYSPAILFGRALSNIVARKELYIHNMRAWRFTLSVAREMNLDQISETLAILIGDENFRQIGADDGYSLFRDAFEVVESFGPTTQTLEFWKVTLAYIHEHPSLSLRLLLKLVRAYPQDWAENATESRMCQALKDYRRSHMELLDTLPDELILAAKEISDAVSDQAYCSGVGKVLAADVGFLLDEDRIRSILSSLRPEPKPDGGSKKGISNYGALVRNRLRDRARRKPAFLQRAA